jgi:hypothetical protein
MSGYIDTYGSTITVDKVRDWLFNGQAYYGTTGQMSSAAGTVDAPMSIFNPANSGKNIFITSIIVGSGTGAIVGMLFATTADPVYASSLKIKNAKSGGAASAIASICTFINTNQTEPAGELRRLYNNYSQEMIPNGFGILLPIGSANGITTFLETYSSGIGSISACWVEF